MYEMLGLSCVGLSIYTDNTVTYDRNNQILGVKIEDVKVTPENPEDPVDPTDPENTDRKFINVIKKKLTADFVRQELAMAPDILYVRCETVPFEDEEIHMLVNEYYLLDNILNRTNIPNIQSKADTIIYNGETYDLDSVILVTKTTKDHAITGITCHNKRYVYNGWIVANNSPCELSRFHWDVKKEDVPENDFCINPFECGLTMMTAKKNCFSFSHGERVLIYVKRNNRRRPKQDSSPLSHLQHSASPVELPKYISYRKFRNNLLGSRTGSSSASPDKKKQKLASPNKQKSTSANSASASLSRASSYSSFFDTTPLIGFSPLPATPTTPGRRSNTSLPATPATPGRRSNSRQSSANSNSSSMHLSRQNSKSTSLPSTPKTPGK